MLLGRARQIRAAADRHGTPPDDVLAALHRRREQLVLEIAMEQTGILGEPQHLARFGQRAAERLLAANADQLGAARFHGAMDPVHDLEPGEVRRQDPYGIDLTRSQHRFERRIRLARTEFERVGRARERFAPRRRRAVDGGHRDMADRDQRLEMEIGIEAGADHADPQARGCSAQGNPPCPIWAPIFTKSWHISVAPSPAACALSRVKRRCGIVPFPPSLRRDAVQGGNRGRQQTAPPRDRLSGIRV
jgi:hypothetical protein